MISIPPKIDLLPEHLIDQIKAGEVIERPGNLIKEILENAVDAGATKLELHVKNNGLDLISLKDNGHGMRFNDLPLAFSRHATSKIGRFEDLYRLRSFGFRGEALASISSISRLQCISFTAREASGAEIRIEGGQTLFHGERQKSADQQGTELVIQDLFFNTPARLKFIQSQQSEKTFIRKIIYAFVLSHPEIEFQLKFDEAEKDIYPANSSLRERLEAMVPKAAGKILYTQRFYENTELEIYLVPAQFKSPFKFQNIYINDRFVLDKQLHRVMSNALLSSFGTDEWQFLVFYNLPADNIDVNVHPSKTIIKCMDSSKMISLLTSTVKELSAPRDQRQASGEIHTLPPSALPGMEAAITLQQERQAYNMEGFFSPHNLSQERAETDLIWIGNFFLRKQSDRWLAVCAPKLLHTYSHRKLQANSPTIPLLVSEPFEGRLVRNELIAELHPRGLELEYLGAETVVLRSIPDWMNGFPLRDVLSLLLAGKSLTELDIRHQDWSQSTWEEMLDSFSWEELLREKIALELLDLLLQRLK